MIGVPITDKEPLCSYINKPIPVCANRLSQKERHSLKGVGLEINRFLNMIKIWGKYAMLQMLTQMSPSVTLYKNSYL